MGVFQLFLYKHNLMHKAVIVILRRGKQYKHELSYLLAFNIIIVINNSMDLVRE
jgi:hypothetical protein